MSIIRTTISSQQAFVEWLTANFVPSLFKSVTISDETITATDDADNVVFTMSAAVFRAYRAAENYIEFSTGGYAIFGTSWPADVIGCDNGFILIVRVGIGGNSRFALLCSKTNNGEPAMIFNSYGSPDSAQVFYNSVKHVAFGDSPTIATTMTFTPESGQQTVLCTFATNVNIGNVSYTPNAFYMPMCQNYNMGIGKFSLGFDVYISNGYWAIKDERATS